MSESRTATGDDVGVTGASEFGKMQVRYHEGRVVCLVRSVLNFRCESHEVASGMKIFGENYKVIAGVLVQFVI